MIEFTKEEALTILKTMSMIEGFLLSSKDKEHCDTIYVFEKSGEAIDLLVQRIINENKVKHFKLDTNPQCQSCKYWKCGGVVGSYCDNAFANKLD